VCDFCKSDTQTRISGLFYAKSNRAWYFVRGEREGVRGGDSGWKCIHIKTDQYLSSQGHSIHFSVFDGAIRIRIQILYLLRCMSQQQQNIDGVDLEMGSIKISAGIRQEEEIESEIWRVTMSFVDIAIEDKIFPIISPSLAAAAALMATHRVLGLHEWNESLSQYTGYSKETVAVFADKLVARWPPQPSTRCTLPLWNRIKNWLTTTPVFLRSLAPHMRQKRGCVWMLQYHTFTVAKESYPHSTEDTQRSFQVKGGVEPSSQQL